VTIEMGSTVNPPKLVELGRFWTSNGGVNLGIKGDPGHVARGVSYHLGKDELLDTAYSIQSPRDRNGLSNAASAIDLGMLDGSFPNLRAFSRWLVARCMADPNVRRDIREIIYSADGVKVQRYSGIDNEIHTGPGNGDLTHLKHTHISYFRDSENSDKLAAFQPFFVAGWGPDVGAEIQALDPSAKKVALAVRRAGHDFGTQVDMIDLKTALANIHHDFGTVVDPGDVQALLEA
jgi:hypothetical protein